MKIKIYILLGLLHFGLGSVTASETGLEYYLPKNTTYNGQISTPESRLGFQVGEMHARHDQVVEYMRHLADSSPRASIIDIGKSWEKRPQILLVITAPENQARLNEIIEQRSQIPKTTKSPSPLVIWLGYSIHGNEASGTNASLLSAYHLVARTDEEHAKFLQDTIVIIEPSLNPDGYGRFSNWVNNNKSQHLSSDPMDREHREDWPNGRSNHYRFDLNRDWLPAQQPESKARLTWFHKFKPHLLGDFHEMGNSNSSYFFQPGVPSRQNPLTPKENLQLTDTIARYHAKAMDAEGRLYFSKEKFDDYYHGKGSTYPDVNGSIGILYEQASVRGHLRDTTYGKLSFPFAIKNHFITTLSTLEGANAQRDQLFDYQQKFFDKAEAAARNDNTRAIVFSDDGDPARAQIFVDVLLRHKIKVYELATAVNIGDTKVSNGFIVPLKQAQYWLIKSIFETRTQFKDNTFYDVSTWTLPYAFNLPFGNIDRRSWKEKLIGPEVTQLSQNKGEVEGEAKVAYAFDWNNNYAAAAVNQLLLKGINVRVARKAFSSQAASGTRHFGTGTIMIPVGVQAIQQDQLHQQMLEIAKKYQLIISSINSGYSVSGVDIGSDSLQVLNRPKPLLLTGAGTSSYDTGELWYTIDQQLHMQLTQVKMHDFWRIKLSNYSHLIMANSSYTSLKEKQVESIREWVREGGVLIAMKSAAKWVADNKLLEINFNQEEESKKGSEIKARAYANINKDDAQQVIGGSIFSTTVDITHPLAFGYKRSSLPVFKNHTLIMEPSSNPYATVVRYNNEPLLSGFVSNKNLEKISNSAMMIAERKGKGSIILILDNPVFRGFWYGSSRLFINSLFFGRSFRNPAN